MNQSGQNVSKYNLPRFRIASSQHSEQGDQSINPNDSLNYSTRTVSSSSTSMMSTPSNNIRRLQQQKTQPKPPRGWKQKKQNDSIGQKKLSKGKLIKSKLLNLQGSSRRAVDIQEDSYGSNPEGLVSHQSMNRNVYDYSVFISESSGVDPQTGSILPPAIKDSQIKAWESAEKVSKYIVFDDSSESSDDDLDENLEEPLKQPIKAIPGYISGELDIISQVFEEQQKRTTPNSWDNEEERKLLVEFRSYHQAAQEKVFAQYSSLSAKRKVQIAQKKDLLHRIFGYHNNMNHDHIINNTSFSALDNVTNTQKVYHEDKEEMTQLVAEDKAYLQELERTKSNLALLKNNNFGINMKRRRRNETALLDAEDVDYERFQAIVASRMDKIYNSYLSRFDRSTFSPFDSHEINDENEVESIPDEFQAIVLSYLRKCIKNGLGGETSEAMDGETHR